ncbi:MAG: hypothetical protein WA777_13010, partial [Rhodanobacter sp.]
QQNGDESARSQTLGQIQAFNQDYPEIKIGMANLRESLKTRAIRSANTENGVMLNRKIAGRVRDDVGSMAQQ